MASEYVPNYAKRKILVAFKKQRSEGFAADIGEDLGYALSNERYYHGANIFIYETREGQEREACKKFLSNGYVDWAELRDLEIEARLDKSDKLMDIVQSLNSDVRLPKDEFNQQFRDIATKILKIVE